MPGITPTAARVAAMVLAAGIAFHLWAATSGHAAGGPAVAVTPLKTVEGTSFQGQVATFTDTPTPTKPPACPPASSYKVTVDWGDGTTASTGPSVSDGVYDSGAGLCDFTVSDGHTYAEEGGYKLGVTVDAASGTGQSTAGATVADATLTAHSGALSAVAGSVFSGTVAEFQDADPGAAVADYAATIDWGDGTSGPGTVSAGPGGSFSVDGSHTWSAPGTNTVGVTIADSGGAGASASSTATVSAGPTADFTCTPGCDSIDGGSTVVFSATSNANAPTYSWSLDGTGVADVSGQSVSREMDFAGHYDVALTVTDGTTGAATTVTHTVVVDQTPTSEVKSELWLLGSPIVKMLLGPEREPGRTTGPEFPQSLPTGDSLPALKMTGPRHKLAVGSVARLGLHVKANKPVTSIAWDLDGDGLRNDAAGTSVAYPVTCPGASIVRVEVVDGFGLHEGDAIRIRAEGTAEPAGMPSAIERAPRTHGSLLLSGHYGPWRRLGTAFGSRPLTSSTAPAEESLRTDGNVGGSFANVGVAVGKVGRGWASSYRAAHGIRNLTADAAGNSATGALVSPAFTLRHALVTFTLGGRSARCHGRPAETASLYVRRGGRYARVATAVPANSDVMRHVQFHVRHRDLGALGVVVVDDGSAAGHVDFSGLSNTSARLQPAGAPLLGWADTHEHLEANQAFGGLAGVKTYMGVPGGEYSKYEPLFRPGAGTAARLQAARNYLTDVRDNPSHFAGPLGSLVMQVAHGTLAGIPLTAFPGFQKMFLAFHEQFHITELHRDWEGGMRLISSLALSDQVLQYLLSDRNDAANHVTITPDKQAIEAHVQAMEQLAKDNSSWMQIVYSPTEAYKAIAAGKLAVVLGVEVNQLDKIGIGTPQQDADWLWRIGIRQVTPIHAVDNGFGGASVFEDVYNMENDFLNRGFRGGDSLTQSSIYEIKWGLQHHGLAVRLDPFHSSPTNPVATAVGPSADYGYYQNAQDPNSCSYVPVHPGCTDFHLGLSALAAGFQANGLCVIVCTRPTPMIMSIAPSDSQGFPFPLDNFSLDSLSPAEQLAQGSQNTLGLSPAGREFMAAVERHGMLLDMEHMSDKSVTDLIQLPTHGAPSSDNSPAWQFLPAAAAAKHCSAPAPGNLVPDGTCWRYAYPIMSSHTNPREDRLRQPSQTTNAGYARTEFNRDVYALNYVDRSGGTMGIEVAQDPKNVTDPLAPADGVGAHTPRWTTTDPATPGMNDCAGSDKGFVQAYLWELNHTVNHRIALATDLAAVGGPGPRFTAPPHASTWSLPTNCPSSDFAAMNARDGSPGATNGPPGPPVSASGCTSPSTVPDGPSVSTAMIHLLTDPVIAGDLAQPGPAVEAAARLPHERELVIEAIRRGELTEEHLDPGQYNHYCQHDPVRYTEAPMSGPGIRPDLLPVPDRADPDVPAADAGGNPVLQRRDFNYQGLVTIGQLPDMLQDVANIGVTAHDLSPLMHSAQAYVDMWTKAFTLNGCLDAHGRPTSSDAAVCEGPASPPAVTPGVCANTCPDDPGDGSSLQPGGTPFDYRRNSPSLVPLP